MSEPQRTEPIAGTIIQKDESGRPFRPTQEEIPASLGELPDPHRDVRKGLFKRVAGEFSPVLPKFERISDAHGRSMTEIASSKKVVWGGPSPGDIFGARTVKGTRMDIGPQNRRIQSWQFGLIAFGLMSGESVNKIIRISQEMRENGLPTEKIVAVKELKEIFVKDKSGKWVKMPIEKWKERVVEEIKEQPGGLDPGIVESYFRWTHFVAVERDVQLDERLEDLELAIRDNRLEEFIKPIFKWLNVVCKTKNSGVVPGTPNPGTFTYSKEDLAKYFQNFLPSQMGTYLGKFHRLGLKHEFLSGQNWSVVGTIYDLDTVNFTGFFPDSNDLDVSTYTLNRTLRSLGEHKFFNRQEVLDIQKKAGKIFLKSYFAEKYGPGFRSDQLNEEEINSLRENNYTLDEVAAVSI